MNDAALTQYINLDEMKADLAIDLTNLTDAMAKQTGLYVHYASKAVRAKRQHERFKAALEVIEAQLNSTYRTTLKEESPKTTEDQIRSAVVNDARWKSMSARVIDSEEIYRLTDVAVRALDHRRDMLLQIARDAAREQAGPLRVQTNIASKERLLELMSGGVAAAAAS